MARWTIVITALGMLLLTPVRGAAQPITSMDAGALETDSEAGTSVGGFLEFIHKLSGPEFRGYGVDLRVPLPVKLPVLTRPSTGARLRLRAAFSYLEHEGYVSETVPADTSDLDLYKGELTVEYTLAHLLGVGAADIFADVGSGASLLSFGGDADRFTNWSVPLFGQLRGTLSGVTLRATGGIRGFGGFDSDAFQPATVSGLRGGVEWVPFWTFALAIGF